MRTARWPAERATGRLLHDREWALVDAHGAAMRLSAHPRMALLAPAVDLFNGEPRSKAFRKVLERHRGGNQNPRASAAEVLP